MYSNGIIGQYPPGLDSSLLYLSAVFFLLLGTLLALEWLWRLGWSFIEHRQPWKSPATVVRLVLVVLLIAGLVRVVPHLWLFMRWPTLAPHERAEWLSAAAQGEIAGVALFTAAWFFGQLGEPMIKYQLAKEPLPLHLWPAREQLVRPLKIGMGVFAIAFAVTYLR